MKTNKGKLPRCGDVLSFAREREEKRRKLGECEFKGRSRRTSMAIVMQLLHPIQLSGLLISRRCVRTDARERESEM
jgi:hypothetical protein